MADVNQRVLNRADAGNLEAMFNIGTLLRMDYRPGPGMDLEKAAFWFNRAAKAGHTDAMYALACLFGRLEPPDPAAAHDWLMKAAHKGHIDAMFMLSRT